MIIGDEILEIIGLDGQIIRRVQRIVKHDKGDTSVTFVDLSATQNDGQELLVRKFVGVIEIRDSRAASSV